MELVAGIPDVTARSIDDDRSAGFVRRAGKRGAADIGIGPEEAYRTGASMSGSAAATLDQAEVPATFVADIS